MEALLIVKGEVVAQVADRFRNALIVFEIHLLIFKAAPEALLLLALLDTAFLSYSPVQDSGSSALVVFLCNLPVSAP